MPISNTGFYAAPLALGDANVPVSVQTLLVSVISGIPSQVFIVPDGTEGNLVITSDPSATGESAGVVLFDTLPLQSSTQGDPVQTASMYLISATANKTFGLIVRTR